MDFSDVAAVLSRLLTRKTPAPGVSGCPERLSAKALNPEFWTVSSTCLFCNRNILTISIYTKLSKTRNLQVGFLLKGDAHPDWASLPWHGEGGPGWHCLRRRPRTLGTCSHLGRAFLHSRRGPSWSRWRRPPVCTCGSIFARVGLSFFLFFSLHSLG